jgi:hypothetical protein
MLLLDPVASEFRSVLFLSDGGGSHQRQASQSDAPPHPNGVFVHGTEVILLQFRIILDDLVLSLTGGQPRTSQTVIRRPRMQGLPERFPGSMVMRVRSMALAIRSYRSAIGHEVCLPVVAPRSQASGWLHCAFHRRLAGARRFRPGRVVSLPSGRASSGRAWRARRARRCS